MPRRSFGPGSFEDDDRGGPLPTGVPGGSPEDLACTPMGQHRRRLDAARRVHLPVAWRREAGDEWYLLPWPLRVPDRILAISPARLRMLATRLQAFRPEAEERAEALLRFTMGSVIAVAVDRVGRIRLPEPLVDRAAIRDEVTLVGLYDRFEIWEPGRLDAVMDRPLHPGDLAGLEL